MEQGPAPAGDPDPTQKIGGVALMVGAVVLIVFSALKVIVWREDTLEEYFESIAGNAVLWKVDNLLLAAGFWAIMVGVVGVHRSTPAGAAAAWTRLGLYGLIVGTALWTVELAAVGLGLPSVARDLDGAVGADKTLLFNVALSQYRTALELQNMSIMVYWLSLAVLGLGMTRGPLYSTWVGWAAVILGATTALVGVALALAGQGLWPVFAVLSFLTLAWALALGFAITLTTLRRPAIEPAEPAA